MSDPHQSSGLVSRILAGIVPVVHLEVIMNQVDARTDDKLISEVVSRLRQHNPNWVRSEVANQIIREVFVGRPQPKDVVGRVMQKFCGR